MRASSERLAAAEAPVVLVTGASRGIGHALVDEHLARGHRVIGISRTLPPMHLSHPRYSHLSIDLAKLQALPDALTRGLLDLPACAQLSRVYLNAGQFSHRIAELRQVPLPEMQDLMDLNVWANKCVLDTLLALSVRIEACVVSSSVAGVRARAGNSAYAVSKAALNMLMQLYALENPSTYVAVLGLCNVDTALAHRIGSLPLEGHFPEIESLRERGVRPGYLAAPSVRARHLIDLLERGLPQQLPSGQFAEVRSLITQPWFQASHLAATP